MAEVPYAKGYLGVNYRTNLSLHRSVGSPLTQMDVDAPRWDAFIGPLPFMLANRDDRPYVRESTSAKRDRFDQARDPGENSLDSSIWLRSFTSWHLGAGQAQAEPLEQAPEIARFRFDKSAGVDVWTAGQISLLRAPVARRTGGVRRCLGVPGKGVVTSTNSGMRLITESTDVSLSATPGRDAAGRSLAVTTQRWASITDAGLVHYGLLAGGGEGNLGGGTPLSGATALVTAKERLWVGAGRDLWEITDVTAALPTAGTYGGAFHRFPDGVIVDIDSGAGGIYIMVVGAVTSIHVLTAAEDGTLNPPREVATLPRGEKGQVLYGYLSRYLVVGTSKGVRIADCSVDTSLPMGPLTLTMTGQGCVDAVADGNFLYTTTGDEGIDTLGDGSAMRPGLYRIDLSRITMPGQQYGDTAASRYAWATDMASPVAGVTTSVTEYNGNVWFAAGGNLYMRGTTPVAMGWLDTGDVNFSTSEQKGWASVRADAVGAGTMTIFADSGSGFLPVVQSVLTTPFHDDLRIDSINHPPTWALALRVVLIGEPILESLLLRAVPAPHRTRYIRMPLLAFDHEADRNQAPVGYDGFAYDRVKDLEALEHTGALVNVWDVRTDEVLSCQIERITFEGLTPPDRANQNWGGVVTVTLLVV